VHIDRIESVQKEFLLFALLGLNWDQLIPGVVPLRDRRAMYCLILVKVLFIYIAERDFFYTRNFIYLIYNLRLVHWELVRLLGGRICRVALPKSIA